MACVTTSLAARPKPLYNSADLIFINVSDPTQTSIPDVQKLVRSHATHNHHSRDRDPNWKPSRSSQIYKPRSISAWTIDQHAAQQLEPGTITPPHQSAYHPPAELTIVRERPEEKVHKPRQSVGTISKRRTSRGEDAGRRNSMVVLTKAGSPISAGSPSSGRSPLSSMPQGRRASVPAISTRSPIRKEFPRNSTQVKRRESRSSLDSLKRTSQKIQNPADALEILARSLSIDMSNVLCYYHYLISAQSTGTSIEDVVAHDLERKWLNPMILSNPTLLSSITLLTISHLRYLKRESHTSASLLKLRGLVLENVQVAIRDSVAMSIADPVVLSIVIMAAYEAFYGTSDCYDVHLKGLTQIVELRGGSVEEGYVDRLLLQFDASVLLGVRPTAKT